MKKADLQDLDPDQAAEDLIEAAGKGITPSPEVIERLIAALKNPGVKAEGGAGGEDAVAVDSLQKAASERAADAVTVPSREEVLKCVDAWVESDMPPGSRWYEGAFGKMKFTEEVYAIMMESLMGSLDSGDDLYVIAKKLTLFHNAPDKWGGDGYSGMHDC